MEGETNNGCLFCATPVLPRITTATIVKEDRGTVKVTVKTGDRKEGVCGWESGFILSDGGRGKDDVPIQNDLKSIFIVRNVLNLPEDRCEQYLRRKKENYPNPASWFAVCEKCNKEVMEYYRTYRKVKQLEWKLKGMKMKFLDLMRETDSTGAKRRANWLLSDDIRACALELADSFVPTNTKRPKRKTTTVKSPEDTEYSSALNSDEDTMQWTASPVPVVEDSNDSDWGHLRRTEDMETASVRTRSRERLKKKKVDKIAESDDIEIAKASKIPKIEPISSILNKGSKNIVKSRHVRLNRLYQCDQCPAVYRYAKLCREHQKLHSDPSALKCPQCGWLCQDGKKLYSHLLCKHPVQMQCKPGPLLRRSIVNNVRLKVLDQEIPYYCDHCHMIFKGEQGLQKHCRTYHRNKPLVTCSSCASKFFSQQQFLMHMEKVHGELKKTEDNDSPLTNQEKHDCSHCSQSFVSKLKKDFHLASIHPESFLKCRFCSYHPKQFRKLHSHMKKTHKNEFRNWCSNFEFTSSSSKAEDLPRASSVGETNNPMGKGISGESSNFEHISKNIALLFDEDPTQLDTSPVSFENDINDLDDKEWIPSDNDDDEDYFPKTVRSGENLHDGNRFGIGFYSSELMTTEGTVGKNKVKKDMESDGMTLTGEDEDEDNHPGPTSETVKSLENRNRRPRRKISRRSNKLKCDLCPAVYVSPTLWKKHKELHINNTGTKCAECGWLCQQNKLGSHNRQRHRKDYNIANGCPDPELSKVYNYAHKKIKRNRKEVPYYCDHCHMIYTAVRILERHNINHHADKPLARCGNCSSEFMSTQLLQIHIDQFHPDMKKVDGSSSGKSTLPNVQKYKCSECSQSFGSKPKLDFHTARIHPLSLLKCKSCDFQATKYCNLQSHIMKRHENAKLVCDFCSKELIDRTSLKLHLTVYHYKEAGLEPLKCPRPECLSVFTCPSGLEKHILHVHDKIKEFCCEHCGKAFARPGCLRKHVLLHTAPRELQYKKGPFICKHCPNAVFNVRQGLYYHMKKAHSDKYLCRCKKCGKGYTLQSMLLQHEKDCKGTGNT